MRSYEGETGMIDKLILRPSIHMSMGMAVVTITLLAALVLGWRAWRGQALSGTARGLLILTQLVLMVQALMGIKLLDQGSGPLQLYIHYVGGLAPLAFFLAASWWPFRSPRTQSRVLALATAGSFVFALMTFAIGQAYVNGSI